MSVFYLLLLLFRYKIYVFDLNILKMRLYNGRVLLFFFFCLIYLIVIIFVNNIINVEVLFGMSYMVCLSKEN